MEGGEKCFASHIANCVLNAFSSSTAIVFNIITIHAIRKTSTLPQTLKILLLSLAVSDLGVGLLAQPLEVAIQLMELKVKTANSPVSDATFKASLLSRNCFALASVFGVVVLSADRFLAIHLHLRYQELVTHKRIVTTVVLVWIFSASLSLASLLGSSANIVFVSVTTILFVCLLTLAFLNYKIFVVVRHHERQMQTLQVRQMAQNIEMVNVGRVRKSAVTALYVYLVFLVCYLPNTCILMMIALSPQPLYFVIKNYCLTLVFLNSSLNPMIYCWRMRDIRHNVIDTLRNMACWPAE